MAPARSISGRTRASLCARRLSITTMSPDAQVRHQVVRDPLDEPFRVHRACHAVLIVSHPSTRIAPIIVRLAPQFMGRGSTYTSPRGTHAWERPIARLRPRFVDKHEPVRVYLFDPVDGSASRCVWTSGRSSSAGRGRFFMNTNPRRCSARRMLDRVDAVTPRHPTVVRLRQFLGCVASGVSRTTASSTAPATGETRPPRLGARRHAPGLALATDPPQSSVQGFTANRSATHCLGLVSRSYARHRSLPKFDRIRIGHAHNRSQTDRQLKWHPGLGTLRRWLEAIA